MLGPRDRLLKLAAIATAAGAFSGLFGVGGGTVIVPLLIFWFAYGEREATGTSLLAIAVVGALAAIGQGIYGNVDLLEGALVGVPAVGGVIAGAALQRPRARRADPRRALAARRADRSRSRTRSRNARSRLASRCCCCSSPGSSRAGR